MTDLSHENNDANTHEAPPVVATAYQLIDGLRETYKSQFKYDEEGHKRAYAVLRETIRFWVAMHEDEALRDAVYKKAAKRKIPVHVNTKRGCPVLTLVNLASGRWIEEKDGDTTTNVWKVNRSHERNAYAVRFAEDNDYTADEVYHHLVNKIPFKLKGSDEEIDATIEDMRAADSRKHNPDGGKQGSVWNDDVEKQLGDMTAIKKVKLTETQIAQFTSHEGYVLVMARISGDQLEILGDAGKDREVTIKTLKARREADLKAAAKSNRSKNEG